MLKTFLSNEFDINAKETVGVEFGSENFIMGKNEDIKSSDMGYCKSRKIYSVTKSYYKGAKGFISI